MLAEEKLCNERLMKHSQLVQRVMFYLADYLPELDARELMQRALAHDTSKFMIDMYEGTKLLDIQDRKLRELNEQEKEVVKIWGRYHYEREFHHPGHFNSCNDMSLLDLTEMVADWTAMAVELKNHNLSAKPFADKVIATRFLFNQEKITTIYNLIDLADEIVQEQNLSNWFES